MQVSSGLSQLVAPCMECNDCSLPRHTDDTGAGTGCSYQGTQKDYMRSSAPSNLDIGRGCRSRPGAARAPRAAAAHLDAAVLDVGNEHSVHDVDDTLLRGRAQPGWGQRTPSSPRAASRRPLPQRGCRGSGFHARCCTRYRPSPHNRRGPRSPGPARWRTSGRAADMPPSGKKRASARGGARV